MSKDRNDYAEVINSLDYTQGLAEHVDIPQADAGILRIITETVKNSQQDNFRILDLGCGPGRLTQKIAEELAIMPDAKVIGLDVSNGFIQFANKHRSHQQAVYLETDFLKEDFKAQKFNMILMQGLVHHIPKDEREKWLLKCRGLLTENGKILIGDEFVPKYSSQEERVTNVVGLYAYVIANALRANHLSLADIESKNMVDDVSSGLSGAGHSDKELLEYIQMKSKEIYELVLEKGTQNEVFKAMLKDLADYIKKRSAEVAETNNESHDRGDFKVSVEYQIKEMEGLGMCALDTKKYGPTDWLGGMAVLVFEKI